MSAAPANLAHLLEWEEARARHMETLAKQGVGLMQAIVQAGDMVSADRATAELAKGKVSAEKLLYLIGSYARFDWAVKHLPRDTLFDMLPELWVQADPDDSDPACLDLWIEAYAANGCKTICDGAALPDGPFTIYRGQIGFGQPGISWTLDRRIAAKFAATGGGRATIKGGVILQQSIESEKVIAYLTGRGESEIIIDPRELRNTPGELKWPR